jgi:hypothetical protein
MCRSLCNELGGFDLFPFVTLSIRYTDSNQIVCLMRDRGVRSFQGCELPDPSHRARQDGLDAATEPSTTLLSCHIESLCSATTAKNDASQYWHILRENVGERVAFPISIFASTDILLRNLLNVTPASTFICHYTSPNICQVSRLQSGREIFQSTHRCKERHCIRKHKLHDLPDTLAQ